MCLWGGAFNPIIPVFRRPPREWKPEIYQRFKGPEVAKGYVRFFEPDVYVEAKEGLLEEAGLGALRQEHAIYPQVLTFGACEHTRNLLNFADATQQVYLGMPSFHQARDAYWRKRLARRKPAQGKTA
jgi:hypothetical protein